MKGVPGERPETPNGSPWPSDVVNTIVLFISRIDSCNV